MWQFDDVRRDRPSAAINRLPNNRTASEAGGRTQRNGGPQANCQAAYSVRQDGLSASSGRGTPVIEKRDGKLSHMITSVADGGRIPLHLECIFKR